MQLNALLNPLKLSAAIGLASFLAGCSGNSSTTVSGPAPVIDPISINKEITEVEWTAANYDINASHAYRVITKNSMLRLVFTNQLAAFDTLVNLFRVDSNRDCNISGRMVAEQLGEICYEVEGGDPTTCVDDSPIREDTQKSQGIACQDGTVAGQYFDGFFNATARTDIRTVGESQTSTTLSAVDTAPTFDENGDPILDEDGDPVLKDFTEYHFQSDTSTFFFDNQYESYVDFSTATQTCGTKEYSAVERQGMRSDLVGTQEGDGTNNFYLYTELTDLELEATPTYICDVATEKVTTDYAYSLTTTMANAGMGGGTDRNTAVTWPDMMISLAGTPSGTLTLVHQNAAGDFTVTVTFSGDTVTVTDGTTSVSHSLAEFLALSEPAAE
ncbi:hypothetical protein A9R00_04020 [Oleispira antarctica]|uniref:Uncharacterized protein n=1 Tax=Oleispira antarctica TaxID=188908 RepID=A0A1Y5HYG0_OLEAN|nr:hypothetical protein A9R00_04020 [Oleispira antarctica]